ncbi:electron transfer flavoprotein subunit alpha/FixB family protein [Salinicola sp. JS01]|uniref:electron transfer flavoprotein subunit alpha/FixB family protein n=1 Tax=Salinicola sp. JS01 TaxID=3050071 RepID=UPI00255BACF3|nr:electron transfer flavoprotein subunit alpha/FixB family protein [Salinicola sp. JS01]WIX33983.1 electron transfer flavoprotein subunit alpha/FixB family protein [Salinicola sp. JS01]
MSVRRLDPHAERARRNRLHPRHLEFARPAWRWTSADGVTRINPHALGAIGPNGIKRIDRSGASVEAAAAGGPQASAEPSRRQITIDTPTAYVAVVPELPEGRLSDHDRDLLGLARQLAEARGGAEAGVAVVAVAFQAEVAGLEEAGADRRVDLSSRVDADSYAPEARLAALAAVETALAPAHWIFADDFPGGGDLGRRLAARLALASTASGDASARAATRVWQFADGQTLSRAGDRQDIQRDVARVLLALPECAEPVSDTRHAATLLDLDASVGDASAAPGVIDRGRVAVDPQQIPLAQAPFILSAGRGVSDWDGYHHAAKVLGASEGASRVAVDDGYMPRARQVGATGTFVSASCYVAVGISGAVQHLQGITKCQRVVAINSDPSCDMVKRADFAIIGDGDAVLAAVCAQLGQPQPESGDSRHEGVRHDAA